MKQGAPQRRFDFLSSPLRYSHIYLTFILFTHGGGRRRVAYSSVAEELHHSYFTHGSSSSARLRPGTAENLHMQQRYPTLSQWKRMTVHALSFDDLTLPLYPFSSENFSLVVQLERRTTTTRTRRGTGTCVWIFPATVHTRCSTVRPII
jgi:hypothetical protein